MNKIDIKNLSDDEIKMLKKSIKKKELYGKGKYKLTVGDDIYFCYSIEEAAKLSGCSMQCIYRILIGKIRFTTKKSKHLNHIKIEIISKNEQDQQ